MKKRQVIRMKKETVYTLFSHPPVIETERLLLRPMRVSDAEDMFEYAKDPDVTKYLTWDTHATIQVTKDYLTYVGQRYRTGDCYDFAVVCRADGRMIGTCGFTKFFFTDDAAEIGYVLNPAYQGQGLMTEAVAALLHFGFDHLPLHRIEARFMQENLRSRRLMERVGMTFEGYARESVLVKGMYRTIGVCAILRDEL